MHLGCCTEHTQTSILQALKRVSVILHWQKSRKGLGQLPTAFFLALLAQYPEVDEMLLHHRDHWVRLTRI